MFSVIISSYNHAAFLPQAVRSALHSPLVEEVLVVDDGSTDDSKDVLDQLASLYPRVTILSRDGENRGASSRYGELIASARAPWISILNSDDYFVPGRFEVLAAAAERHRCEMFGGGIRMVNSFGTPTAEFVCPPSWAGPRQRDFLKTLDLDQPSQLIAALLCCNFLTTTSGMTFRKTLFDRLTGFRPYYYVHDWDFALRAALAGELRIVEETLTAYRVHGDNTIRSDRSAVWDETREMVTRILEESPQLRQDTTVARALELNAATPLEEIKEMEMKTTDCVIVLGMHRSGTSAVARLVQSLGCYAGSEESHLEPNQWNADGYCEHRDLVALSDQLLREQESNWSDVVQFQLDQVAASTTNNVRQRYRYLLGRLLDEAPEGRSVVLKDPRLCLTLPTIQPEPGPLVFVYRHPLEVAASLDTRDGMGIATGLALWELYTLRASEILQHRPCLSIDYNTLLKRPRDVVGELGAYLADQKALDAPGEEIVRRTVALVHPSDRKEDPVEVYAEFLMPRQQEMLQHLHGGRFAEIARSDLSAQSLDLLRQHHKLVKSNQIGWPVRVFRNEMGQMRGAQRELFGLLDHRLSLIEERMAAKEK